jgi:hypothetical protein
VTWSIVMMGLTLAVGSLCSHLGGAWFGPDYRGMLQDVGYFAISGGIALQAVAYALTALLIWQRFWPKAREALTWSILVAIIAATFVLPVAGALTTSEYGSSGDTWLGTWYVLTPVGLSEGYSDVRHLTIEVATLWAGLMLFYNVFWIVERMRTFGRHGRDGRRARVEAARGALTVADPPDGGAP